MQNRWRTVLPEQVQKQIQAFEDISNGASASIIEDKDCTRHMQLAQKNILIINAESAPEIMLEHSQRDNELMVIVLPEVNVRIISSYNGAYASYTFFLATNARLDFCMSFAAHEGERQIKIKCHAFGENAHANIRGAYVARGSSKVTLITEQHHAAFNTHSELLLKGYVTDEAKSIHRGMVVIEKDAQRAHASQYNKTLLGSMHAQAQSTPQLEILAHDVHCKHGTALGHIDEQQLLYLQTRGFDEKRAQHLLLEAFFSEFDLSLLNLSEF